MKELLVKIEVSGENKLVGRLLYNTYLDAIFKYDKYYMEGIGSVPISLSLQFQDEPFTPWQTIWIDSFYPYYYYTSPHSTSTY